MGVLDAMIRYDISLARSVELTAQWDRVLAAGPLHPVTFDDLSAVRGLGIDGFYWVVCGVHHMLSDFIHGVAVHRRDEAIRRWRNWLREDPVVHPSEWLRPDLVLPAPFCSVTPLITPAGSGVLSDPARIDEEFRMAWRPYFCRSGQGETSLEEFNAEVDGWLPLLPEVHLPRLTGVYSAPFLVSASSYVWWFWVLADPARIDQELRKARLPYFCRSGQRDTSLEEFNAEVEEWLPLLPEVSLRRLTGQVLADVVHRKGATAGSLDGWEWRELKVLPVSWYDELARILSKVEDTGVWPDGLLDAYIAMIPQD